MRLEFDPEADAAYIYLKGWIVPGETKGGDVCDVEIEEAAILFDFDGDGRLLGIEFLGASKLLPKELIEGSWSP